jgi:hypothetical protein
MRESGRNLYMAAVEHEVTCVCGDWNTDTPAPSVAKLADAIEALTDAEDEP